MKENEVIHTLHSDISLHEEHALCLGKVKILGNGTTKWPFIYSLRKQTKDMVSLLKWVLDNHKECFPVAYMQLSLAFLCCSIS